MSITRDNVHEKCMYSASTKCQMKHQD